MTTVGAGALGILLQETLSPCFTRLFIIGFGVPHTYQPVPPHGLRCSSAQHFTWRNPSWPSGLSFSVISWGRLCLSKLLIAAFAQCPCTSHSQPHSPAFYYHGTYIPFICLPMFTPPALGMHAPLFQIPRLFCSVLDSTHGAGPHLVNAQ